MPDLILVINPNSTDAVTRAIDDAMAPLRITGGPGVDCMTLRQGPPGVESQSDGDAVISILARSVPRHLRYSPRWVSGSGLPVGDLPIGLGVTELSDARSTRGCMIDVGSRLRDENGADVLVMGCAGMARYRADLEEAVRIPVVEPTQAAVATAIGRIRLGW
jgi:Asp/Glu/hydantoin racemase